MGVWCFTLIALASTPARTQAPLQVLDVPFIAQSEALCGGAAAAMVMRYWGQRGVTAESFSALVDKSVAGIRTDALVGDLRRRGWAADGVEGADALLEKELVAGRPVVALIEDRPGTFHYVVVVSATPAAVLFHDPARAPFRGMARGEFTRRWTATRRWMAVIVPGAVGTGDPAAAVPPRVEPVRAASDDACRSLLATVAERVNLGDASGAEAVLTTSGVCAPSVTFRELAGLRASARRWPEAAELASAAVGIDPSDQVAQRVLATSRFLQADRPGALAAWNAAGEPTLDTVQVDGLTRTRVPVALRAAGLQAGQLVTLRALMQAQRRLVAVPAFAAAGVEYVPVPGGRAEVRAHATDRPLLPTSLAAAMNVGAGAIFARSVTVPVASPTGGGDRLDVNWRYWRGWPRVGADYFAPAPWGGVWGVGASWERQPFNAPILSTQERKSARASWSDWVAPSVRLTLRGGADRWVSRPEMLALGGLTVLGASDADRVRAQIDLDSWFGHAPFSMTHGILRLRSSNARKGLVVAGQAGAGFVGDDAPPDIWFGGDTGRSRPVPLRAHRLFNGGRMSTERIGRSIVHGSVEGQYWWQTTRLPIGLAAFVDTAQVDRRALPGLRRDADVGLGLRAALLGSGRTFRMDVAKGLTDGNVRVSFGFEP